MKHSPVLMLGLAILILSNASAASAREPLTFDPITFDPPPTNQSVTYTTAKPTTDLPSSIETAKAPIDRSRQSQHPDHSPNLPLFELPPFQSDPSNARLARSEPDSDYSSSTKPAASIPDTEVALDATSPFELPDHLTDADLFEAVPEQAIETDSFKSAAVSPADSGIEFETAPELEVLPSLESSKSDRLNQPADSQSGSVAASSVVKSESLGYLSSVESIGLNFDPPNPANSSLSDAQPVASSVPIASSLSPKSDQIAVKDDLLDQLFKGDSDSLVAVAVGSAEGTRTPDGGKNSAYQGHTDPGNGVWNLGSFSYQHGANSPEEADAKQLARLRSQAQTILDKAAAKGLELSLEEKLNAIDLANQAPKAALDQYGGYIDWLADARASGLGGNEAILWARVHSFLDPYTQTWNAPGLGNSEERITSDQERRILAIAKAIATYAYATRDVW